MSVIATFIVILVFLLISWIFWREYHYLQTSVEWDEHERKVLMNQLWVLVIGTLLSTIIGYFSFMWSVVATYPPFLYVALSTIRNKVSILRGRGVDSSPVKGEKAVFIGVMLIVIMVMHMIMMVSFYRL